MAAALFLLGPAAIHVAVVPDHVRAYLPYGLFFIAIALLQVALAAAILVRPSPTVLLGGAVLNLLIIAVWIASRTVGLPLTPTPGQPEAVGFSDLLATVMEWVAVILLLIADIRLARSRPFRLGRSTPGLALAAIFSVAFTVAGLAAVGSVGH